MSATLNDGVIYSLASFSGDANARIAAWLRTKIVVPPTVPTALNDLWALYMNQIPVVGGTTDERISRFMKAIIGTDVPNLTTYNDIQNAFWNGAYAPDTPTSGTIFTNRVSTGWIITRPSAATDTGLTGLLTQVANNTAYYNASKGIYAEETRTNQQANSEDFSAASYARIGIDLIAAATTAPSGQLTGTKWVAAAITSNHEIRSVPLSAPDTTYSIYLKAAEFYLVRFFTRDSYAIDVDLRTGTLLSLDPLAIVTIVPVGNGWYRISIRQVDAGPILYVANLAGEFFYEGDGVSGVYAWGAQN